MLSCHLAIIPAACFSSELSIKGAHLSTKFFPAPAAVIALNCVVQVKEIKLICPGVIYLVMRFAANQS